MKNNNLLRRASIFGGCAILFASFFMYAGCFLRQEIEVLGGKLVTEWSGYNLCFPADGGKAYGGVLAGWILSLVLLVAALAVVTVFVLEGLGKVKAKILDNKMARGAVAACFVLLGLTVGILCFCTVAIVDAKVDIGAGAVFGGILHIMGASLIASGVALPALAK